MDYRSERRKTRIEKGLCTFCGCKNKHSAEFRHCDACRSRHQRNRRKRRASDPGLCSSCVKKKPRHGKKTCDVCIEIVQRSHRERKARVLQAYGGSCSFCGESNLNFLVLDHVNDDGAEHRKTLRGGPVATYRWAEKEKFPDRLQVLCHNCNAAKRCYRLSEDPELVLASEGII